MLWTLVLYPVFFLPGQASSDIYTLSLHDALPIYGNYGAINDDEITVGNDRSDGNRFGNIGNRRRNRRNNDFNISKTITDRKSTRLNSSHLGISYAVFCLKKKKTTFRLLGS